MRGAVDREFYLRLGAAIIRQELRNHAAGKLRTEYPLVDGNGAVPNQSTLAEDTHADVVSSVRASRE